jgi:hypothetical protein
MGGSMNRVKTYLEENYPDLWESGDILLADGFEDAFVGVVESHGAAPKACYNYDACIDILMKDMDEGEALEFMEFNVTSAYVGEYTPAFIKLDLGDQKL